MDSLKICWDTWDVLGMAIPDVSFCVTKELRRVFLNLSAHHGFCWKSPAAHDESETFLIEHVCGWIWRNENKGHIN